MQSHGQPLKQEGGFSAVRCAVRLPISCTSSMACWLHYFIIIIIILPLSTKFPRVFLFLNKTRNMGHSPT